MNMGCILADYSQMIFRRLERDCFGLFSIKPNSSSYGPPGRGRGGKNEGRKDKKGVD